MSSRRIAPHQIVIVIGVAFGVFTLASGVVSVIEGWHDDSPISREVFSGVPGALQVAFYTLTPMLLVYGAIVFSQRVRNWERGAPDRRKTTPQNVKRRLADFRAGVYMQTLLRDPAAGHHALDDLLRLPRAVGVTTVLEIDHQMPESAEVPARPHLPGVRVRRRPRRRRLPRRHPLGDRAPLRAAALPHPHQDQARARA